MSKTFRILVFGKTGCDKCHVLNQRIDKILAKDEWKDFEKQNYDIESEDGIVRFCEAECINPQRIPAMVVARRAGDAEEYEPMPNPSPGKIDPVCGKSRLYQYLGLQTDYRDGGGTLTPNMIQMVLSEARA